MRFEVAAKYRSRPKRNFLGRRAFEDHLPKMPTTLFIVVSGHRPMLQRGVAISVYFIKAERTRIGLDQ